ncbi:hypothetical protein [uncultured Gammaproteobacteria bacterium]|uniref:hypothetical protein n=1 Tax=Bathymodiolus heckerae thiotrophic gill symbiont TaxID=1052212 RepID=UPI0010FDA67D|nr:hypothetical protein [Bathymodiolus heckerae thiotrophic gill symbiont]CAC9449720.1 hypothetical protein [uncultured Gammaproteobacteria bacterium]
MAYFIDFTNEGSGVMKKLSLSVLLLASVALTGCGGGGGASSGVNFPDNATLAEANEGSGEKVAKSSVSKSPSYGLNNVGDSSGANSSLIAHNISNILSESIKNLPQSNALNTIKDIDKDCDIKGTTLSSVNTDTGAYTLTFHDCKNNDTLDTMNGSMSGTIVLNNNKLKKFSFTITSTLSTTKNSVKYSTMQIGSSMVVEYSEPGNNNKNVKVTMSAIGVENSKKYGCKNCEFYTKFLNNHDIQIYQTKGQLYIGENLEAYVIYNIGYDMSTTPFVFSNNDGKVIDGGIAKYITKDDKVIEIRVESNVVKLYIDGTFSKVIDL